MILKMMVLIPTLFNTVDRQFPISYPYGPRFKHPAVAAFRQPPHADPVSERGHQPIKINFALLRESTRAPALHW